MKKKMWMQTPEGRKKIGRLAKARWKKRKAVIQANKQFLVNHAEAEKAEAEKATVTNERGPTILEEMTFAARRQWIDRDSRVINRRLSVLDFELAANQDHHDGLVQSLNTVMDERRVLQAEREGVETALQGQK